MSVVTLLTYESLLDRAEEKGILGRVRAEYENFEWIPEVVIIVDFENDEGEYTSHIEWENGEILTWLEDDEIEFEGRWDKPFPYQIDFEKEGDATYFLMVWG